jgi:hypothetical protein
LSVLNGPFLRAWLWNPDDRPRPNGRGDGVAPPPEEREASVGAAVRTEPATFAAYMVTCDERRAIRARTLASFRATDWGCDPELQVDDGAEGSDKLARIHATWLAVLERVAAGSADFALVMEDDLDFNIHLRRNVTTWAPLRDRHGGTSFFGSIYNPGRQVVWRPSNNQPYFIAAASFVWGAQALVMSRFTAEFFLRNWSDESGAADVRMPKLAERLSPVYFHVPSLVQHEGSASSTWGGRSHRAVDFDANWRAAD